MALKRARRMPLGVVVALLLSVGVLLCLSVVSHSHDGGMSPTHCEACRWAGDATPALGVLLVFLLTLPESGSAPTLARAFRTRTSRRRIRSRGPPLV